MMFKVGDKVKIREDLKVSASNDVVHGMLCYAGSITTIVFVYDYEGEISYELDIDKGQYSWGLDLFELVEPSETGVAKEDFLRAYKQATTVMLKDLVKQKPDLDTVKAVSINVAKIITLMEETLFGLGESDAEENN